MDKVIKTQVNSWHHKLFHFQLSFWIWKVWKGKKKRKSQPNFWHYVKKIEAQTKKMVFLYKKKVYDALMTFLKMASKLLISLLMILRSTLSVIELGSKSESNLHSTADSERKWLTYMALWTLTESGLFMEKLSLFHVIVQMCCYWFENGWVCSWWEIIFNGAWIVVLL